VAIEAAAKAVRHELEQVEAVNDYTYSERGIREICDATARAAIDAYEAAIAEQAGEITEPEVERLIDKMLDYDLLADPEDSERNRVIACDLIRTLAEQAEYGGVPIDVEPRMPPGQVALVSDEDAVVIDLAEQPRGDARPAHDNHVESEALARYQRSRGDEQSRGEEEGLREALEAAFEFIEGLPEPNDKADALYDRIGGLLATLAAT
jgi:hypothetical protein